LGDQDGGILFFKDINTSAVAAGLVAVVVGAKTFGTGAAFRGELAPFGQQYGQARTPNT